MLRGLRLLWRWGVRLLLLFLMVSIAQVIWHRFGPVPETLTMRQDRARHGQLAYDYISFDQMSAQLPLAVVAAEDARFCQHSGFDWQAIRAAMALNAKGRRLYGASTLSQQVAKNLFLWPERSWLRKGLEAWFTLLIESFWSKRRILEVYLNVAAFDTGVYGVSAAARAAFNRSAGELIAEQAARLAQTLPAPHRRDARALTPAGRARLRKILGGMQTLTAQGRDACWH